MGFDGQTIVVTGAASGMGLETARQLADEGANLALLDIDEAALREAAASLADETRILWRVADTADTDAMEAAIDAAAERFGAVDGLVANAGIRMRSTPVTDLDDEVWDRLVRVNLRGTFVAVRAAARVMKAYGTQGSIVTVASISGQVARIDQSAYCASKAGVIQLSKALAVELAEHGIRVNAVCPGTVNTPMLQMAQSQDGAQVLKDRIFGQPSRFRAGIPLRRIAESEDVAAAIVFLLSRPARHITGQALSVDGGESSI